MFLRLDGYETSSIISSIHIGGAVDASVLPVTTYSITEANNALLSENPTQTLIGIGPANVMTQLAFPTHQYFMEPEQEPEPEPEPEPEGITVTNAIFRSHLENAPLNVYNLRTGQYLKGFVTDTAGSYTYDLSGINNVWVLFEAIEGIDRSISKDISTNDIKLRSVNFVTRDTILNPSTNQPITKQPNIYILNTVNYLTTVFSNRIVTDLSGVSSPAASVGEGDSIELFFTRYTNFQKNIGFFAEDEITGQIIGNVDLAHNFINANPHDRRDFYDSFSQRILLIETQLVIILNIISYTQSYQETLNRLSFYLTENVLSSPLLPITPMSGTTNLDSAFLQLFLPAITQDVRDKAKDYITTMIYAAYDKGSNTSINRQVLLTDLTAYKEYTLNVNIDDFITLNDAGNFDTETTAQNSIVINPQEFLEPEPEPESEPEP